MAHLLGIDVSTTATKALLADERGRVVGIGSSPHALATPRPAWAEQEPADWWRAVVEAIREVLAATGVEGGSVAAVGLTGQMHGLVLLGPDGEPLRPAILWNDQRAAAECDEIRRRVGFDELVRRTGNDAFPGFSAPKLLWVERNEPDVYSRVRSVLLPKDYVRFRLTGDRATDRADAGGTGWLDLASRDWSPEVLGALGVPAEWLPPTHEGTETTGTIGAAAAAVTGLAAGTPVVAGGGDQAAQAVGAGAVRPGVLALTLGTSGVVFAPTGRPLHDPRGRFHAFPHAVPGRWHVMGVMLSAAGSLRWYRDAFAAGVGFDRLLAEAAEVPPGCEGVTFLPYLSGERTPHADPRARGAFTGLALGHGRGHLTRAVLEGVAFGLRDNLDLVGTAGLEVAGEIRVSGGGARSATWRQVIADVLGLPLVASTVSEGAAFGAALLAGVGVGNWPDVDGAVAEAVTGGEATAPDPRTAPAYRDAHARFRSLYPALAGAERHAAGPAAVDRSHP